MSRRETEKELKAKGIVRRMVPDPEKAGHRQVHRVVKAHPLDFFYDRGRISIAQATAGYMYFKAYCVWTGQENMSIDLSVDKVDTSGFIEAFSPKHVDAAQIIKSVSEALGKDRNERFRMITGEGYFPKDVAKILDKRNSGRAIMDQTDRWIESLQIVAREFNFA